MLRSLLLLAEGGSIANVARSVHLSPAAVHKQLKALESELGVHLYERLGRGLHLTPPAELLIPHIKDILAQHDLALRAIEDWKGLRKGLVRIGAGPTISSYILPGLLNRFRRAHKKIDLFVETGHSPVLIEGLVRGTLDLALLVSSELLAEPGLTIEAVWDCEFVVVSNLRNAPSHCGLRQLDKFPFILFQRGSRMENLIDRYFAERGFQPNVIMRFDNAEAIKAMIRTGLGISMLPLWAVDSDIRKGALSLVRQHEPALVAKIALARRKGHYVSSAVREFVELGRRFPFRNPRLVQRR